MHADAVARLSEKRKLEQSKSKSSTATADLTSSQGSSAPRQATLMTIIQSLKKTKKHQLTRKFQLVHFNTANAKSFRFYGNMASFCRQTYKVFF